MLPSTWRAPAAALFGAAVALGFLALTLKPVIEGDGVPYFAYLHAAVVRHSLDLGPEYAAAQAEHANYYPPLLAVRGAGGLPADFFPVGPAVLTLPAYLVALLLDPAGGPQYGPPFSVAVALTSLLLGLLALALAYRLARESTGSAEAAVLGTVAAAVATPFVYYLVYQPSYSHTYSAFAVGAFLYVWWRLRGGGSWLAWLGLGALGGLMALVRFQDGLLLLLALIDLPRARWRLLFLGLGALLAFTPQLVVDQALFGSWLPVRPNGQALSPWPGYYLQVLFSSHHGFFVWTPAALLAIVGYRWIPDRRLRLAFVLALLVETFVNGAAPDWWGGFSFGQRRFVDLTPFLAVGLAGLALRLRPLAARLGLAALGAWNLLLIANFTYVIRGDNDPGYFGLVAGQLAALRYLPHLFVQGGVVRALVARPLLPGYLPASVAVALLIGEAACLLVAVAATLRLRPRLGDLAPIGGGGTGE